MKLRLVLFCTLLLLAASSSFALPLCAHCDEWNTCDSASGDIERCRYDLNGNCFTDWGRCSIPSNSTTVLNDWKVVSVDVERPSQEAFTVTTQAPAAEVVKTAAPQKVAPQ